MSNKKKLGFLLAILVLPLAAPSLRAGDDEFFFRRGEVEYKNRQYKFAIEDMGRVLAINSGHFRAANILGEIYGRQKLRKKSLDYYRISIGANPSQPDIHYRMGVLYDFFYDTRSSTVHYLKAVEQDPSHRRAHLKLVRHYIGKKDIPAADRHFNESYRLGKSEGDARLILAKKEYDSGREAAALVHYRKAIAKNPADLETYFRVSEILRRAKDYRGAVRYLEKVKHIRPDHERAHVMLGNLYYTVPLSKNRKFLINMAIANLDAALELNPKNRDAILLLSEIHRKLGDVDRADAFLKKFEKLEGEEKR